MIVATCSLLETVPTLDLTPRKAEFGLGLLGNHRSTIREEDYGDFSSLFPEHPFRECFMMSPYIDF